MRFPRALLRNSALPIAAVALAAGSATPAKATPTASVVSDAPPLTVAQAAHQAMASRSVPVLWGLGSPDGAEEWQGDDWAWVDRLPPAPDTREKSLVRAVAWSAFVPGLGERYTDNPGRARLFYVAEAAIWSTFAYYRIQARVREDSQIEFANLNAGAATEQDANYYQHIGLWLSLEEWHDIVRRDARQRFPDDAAAQEAYFLENQRYDQGQSWEWADDAERNEYRRQRSATERSYRNARLAVGVAVVNRLVSMIDALGLARGHNRRLQEEGARLDLRIGPQNTVDGLVIGPILSTRY